ncbi:MAG: hypothetical protein HY308_04275 [Gammaproteobacteria bacterium]|nr:hypothetical protein [Gammaproteobacteria bacterium]
MGADHLAPGPRADREIRIERVVSGNPSPRCIAGKYACPPEDCGGPAGYAEVLRALRGRGGRRREVREWLGSGFDPKKFSVREVNVELAKWVNER